MNKPTQTGHNRPSTSRPENDDYVPEVRRKKKKRKKIIHPLAKVVEINQILEHYKLAGADWDAIIIGDGSATTWSNESGWASVLLEKESPVAMPFFGGMSNGTNIVAEIMAIYQPLLFLHCNRDRIRNRGYQIIAFSDCQHVVTTINSMDMAKVMLMKTNRPLWISIMDMLRTGFTVKAVHMPRNSLPAALFSHNAANSSRKLMCNLKQQEQIINGRLLLE